MCYYIINLRGIVMSKYDSWDKQQLLRYYNEAIQKWVDSNNTDEVALRTIATCEKLIKGPTPPFISPTSIKGKINEDRMFLLKDLLYYYLLLMIFIIH